MPDDPPSPRRPPAPHTKDELEVRLRALSGELGEWMTLDGLTHDFTIFQRRRGHRHSTDDLLTAWYAATHARTPVVNMLDLGTGIGSVGLSLAWYYPQAKLTAIEVQDVSFTLLLANVWANGVESRVKTIHGDLRKAVPPGEWDLITGSPPYFDVRTGIVSADPQRAGARFELCGDVRDYCKAARRSLTQDGRFIFCFPTAQRPRAEQACESNGLAIVEARDVVPKTGLPALFSLYSCVRDDSPDVRAREDEPAFVVREANGRHTSEMTAARALFGMGLSDN